MKKIFTTLVCLLMAATSWAYDFEVDGLYYNLVSASDRTCELVGGKEGLTSIVVPANVTTRGITLAVINLSPNVFENNSSIQKLEFLAPIEVSNSAFSGCVNLSEVLLSDGVITIGDNAFKDCPIDSLFVPNTITKIGKDAINLVKNVYIEDGETELDCSGEASSMTKLYLGRNLAPGVPMHYVENNNGYYIYELFHKKSLCGPSLEEIHIGLSVTTLGESFFDGCKNLREISIPQNITEIGINAFRGCSKLTHFVLEDGESPLKFGMTYVDNKLRFTGGNVIDKASIDSYGPLAYSPLEVVYIGRNIDYIRKSSIEATLYPPSSPGSYWISYPHITLLFEAIDPSFLPHKTIKDFSFGPNVVTLCNYMFYGQTDLSLLQIPKSINSIGAYCFSNSAISQICMESQNATIGGYAFENCLSLSRISLKGVSFIGEQTFSGCTGLKIAELGNSIQSIGKYVFKDCSSLLKVDLGGLKVLPQGTFANCNVLNWISFGEDFTSIEQGAMNDCKNIYTIGLKSVSPPLFKNSTEVSGINKFSATLYIPQGTTSAYEQASVWKDFLFKEETEIPEFVYTLPKPDDSVSQGKNMIVNGILTGDIINQINASSSIETLDLTSATIALDNKAAYYESGKRIADHWEDLDVIRWAPYTSYKYYTAPETTSGVEKEYNKSGTLINIINICFSSDLTNANLNGNLKRIMLPNSMTKLGENAFKGTNLSDVFVYTATPPIVAPNTFGEADKSTCVLHVPEGCKEVYANANGWREFLHIVETSFDNHIAEQPNNLNRTVKLAREDSNATYQWYKYIEKSGDVFDITNLLYSTDGWEFTGNSWRSSMHNAESSAALSYQCGFNPGDVLSFDWSVHSEEIFDQLQCYFNDELLLVKSGDQSGVFTKKFDSAVTGKLTFIYTKDKIIDSYDDNALISNVKITSSESSTMNIPEAITGATASELTKDAAADGEKVFCMVTLSDGRILKSNEFVLEYVNFIKIQPTAENLSFELDTPDPDAKYQWFVHRESKKDSEDISGFDVTEDIEITGATKPSLDASIIADQSLVYCKVFLSDGAIIQSERVAAAGNYIVEQPTADNVSIRLKMDCDKAVYYWYRNEYKEDDSSLEFTTSEKCPWTYSDGVWTSGNKKERESLSRLSTSINVEKGDTLSFDWTWYGDEGTHFVCKFNGEKLLKDVSDNAVNHNGHFEKVFDSSCSGSLEFIFTIGFTYYFQDVYATISNLKLSKYKDSKALPNPVITEQPMLSSDQYVDGDTLYCVIQLSPGNELISDRVVTDRNILSTKMDDDHYCAELKNNVPGVLYQWYLEKNVQKVKDVTKQMTFYEPNDGLNHAEWLYKNGVWKSGGLEKVYSCVMKANTIIEIGDTLSFEWSKHNDHTTHLAVYLNYKNGTTNNHYMDTSAKSCNGSYNYTCIEDYDNLRFEINRYSERTICSYDYAKIWDIKLKGDIVRTLVPISSSQILDKSSCIKNDVVYCVATLPNGRKIYGDKLTINDGPSITRHPSADDLSVVVENAQDAEYHWFVERSAAEGLAIIDTLELKNECTSIVRNPQLVKNDDLLWCEITLPNGRKLVSESVRMGDMYSCEAVDLQLPSGTLWSNMYLGAHDETDAGCGFAWGELEEKDSYSWENYMNCYGTDNFGQYDCGTDKDPLKEYTYPINKTISGTQYDAVTYNLGEGWCIPTRNDYEELVANCSVTNVSFSNGKTGKKYVAKNGNYIIICDCTDWCADACDYGMPYRAYHPSGGSNLRYKGFSYRPVYKNKRSTGDLNGDSVITVLDIVMLISYLNGVTPTSFIQSAADMDNNKIIDKDDLDILIDMFLQKQNR